MKLEGLPQTLSSLAGKAKRAGTKSLEEVAENIRRRMSEEGKPIKYPVRWDSEKQRRAFFATNGFGKGIPHKRTHSYRKGWKVKKFSNGVALQNKHPAGAIGGDPKTGWQSRIHRGRWKYLPSVVLQEAKKLPEIVLKNLRVEFR